MFLKLLTADFPSDPGCFIQIWTIWLCSRNSSGSSNWCFLTTWPQIDYSLCPELLIGLNNKLPKSLFVGTQNWAHNCKWVGQPALIRWLVIALNCFYNFHLSDQEMKRHGLTLRASCKEPNYGISLLTVSLPGRRLCSYVVAWEAGAAQLKSSLGILSPFQSDSGKWRRQIKPCRIKWDRPPIGRWGPSQTTA